MGLGRSLFEWLININEENNPLVLEAEEMMMIGELVGPSERFNTLLGFSNESFLSVIMCYDQLLGSIGPSRPGF